MIFDISKINNIYIKNEYVDFRKRVNGLVNEITNSMYLNADEESLFVFINKRRTSIKIIYYEINGFWLFQKTLLNKDKFMWIKNNESTTVSIEKEQFEWLLRGLEIEPKKHFKKVKF